jgi:hypothetical protein
VSGVPRHLVEAAVGLLGVGAIAEAVGVLLDALEESSRSQRIPPPCPVCGVRAWPGEEWRHVCALHHPPAVRRAA